MIKSDKDEKSATIHDFTDYAFATEVCRDHPRIIKVYEKLLPVLYNFGQYQGVYPVLQMIEDSKLLLELQLDFYQKIYKRKGRIEKKDK